MGIRMYPEYSRFLNFSFKIHQNNYPSSHCNVRTVEQHQPDQVCQCHTYEYEATCHCSTAAGSWLTSNKISVSSLNYPSAV